MRQFKARARGCDFKTGPHPSFSLCLFYPSFPPSFPPFVVHLPSQEEAKWAEGEGGEPPTR